MEKQSPLSAIRTRTRNLVASPLRKVTNLSQKSQYNDTSPSPSSTPLKPVPNGASERRLTRSQARRSPPQGVNENNVSIINPSLMDENSCASPSKKRSARPNLTVQTPTKRVREQSTPRSATPRTPLSILQDAKDAFRRCATPSRLIGREQERQTIQTFLASHVLEGKSGSLYISGCPGTGKTALLNETLATMKPEFRKTQYPIKQATMNCMSASNKRDFFKLLLKLITKEDVSSYDEAVEQLESLFLPSKMKSSTPIYLILLDEIDYLLTKDQDILYHLFDWCGVPSSRLVLVGIANALDFTSRFLPRLKAKGCEPELLNFNPYTVHEITAIIKDRLAALDENEDENDAPTTPTKKQKTEMPATLDTPTKVASGADLMHPMAIELAARKIADTGDLRKALDVCRQAIELAENEVKTKLLQSKLSDAVENENPLALLPPPKITIKHVLNATNAMLGSPNVARIKELNLQLKLVLCTLTVMQKLEKKDFSLGKVHETYIALCRYRNQAVPVQRTEFNDLISNLEVRGLVSLVSKRAKEEFTAKTLQLVVRMEDVQKAVSGNQILEVILENGRDALRKVK